MANSYKANKFRNDLPKATVESTADTTTPSIDDNFDIALEELQSVCKEIKKQLTNISTEVKKLQTNKKSGTEIVTYCKKTVKKVDDVKEEIDSTLKGFSNVVNAAQKAEYKRMMAWIREQMAATSNNA